MKTSPLLSWLLGLTVFSFLLVVFLQPLDVLADGFQVRLGLPRLAYSKENHGVINES